MSINDPLSPIRLQLMWDRLIAVVEEQALALIRTGFSTHCTCVARPESCGMISFSKSAPSGLLIRSRIWRSSSASIARSIG